jgi:hypothetical protein
LFRINDQLEHLGIDIEKFSEKEMVKKVIGKTLNQVARLKYIRRGGKILTTKQAIGHSISSTKSTRSVLNEAEDSNDTTSAVTTMIPMKRKKATTKEKAHETCSSRTHVASTTRNTNGAIA